MSKSKAKYPEIELMLWIREFNKEQQNMERMYWTSRETDFNKDIWYEESPGVANHMWFPYATWFMSRFPWLAVRVFWLVVGIKKAWNIFVSHYPPVCPNFFADRGE